MPRVSLLFSSGLTPPSDEIQAPQRLEQVLDYLRNTYHYCFWCGTQYASVEELAAECPGLTEEEHD